jgi:hypothetical protein
VLCRVVAVSVIDLDSYADEGWILSLSRIAYSTVRGALGNTTRQSPVTMSDISAITDNVAFQTVLCLVVIILHQNALDTQETTCIDML